MSRMATGDVEGNLERMRVQLRSIAYPHPLDIHGLREGLPAAFLPLLHYALLGYSRHVARYLSACGYELYAKSDLRFIECTLKFLRTEFNYRCSLTLAQLFTKGFVERKLHFVHDVIQICKRKHYELLKQFRQARFMCKSKTARRSNRCEMENQVPPADHCPAADEDMSDVDQLSDAKYHDNDESMCHLQGELLTAGPQKLSSTCGITNQGDNSEERPPPKAFPRGLLRIEKQLSGNVPETGAQLKQEKLASLEDRVSHLEHHPPCEVVTGPPNVIVNYNKTCEENGSETSSLGHASASGMKDISNTHQRYTRDTYCPSLDREISGGNLTQEFIAKVKARFNHAKKLLDEN